VKRVFLGLIVGLVLGAAAMWFGQKHPGARAKPETEPAPQDESFVHRGTNNDTFLKLDQETQDRVGLRAEPLAAAQLQPEVKGYGRVLDPAPLAALLVELATAKAALEVSMKEFQRLKVLHAQDQNVSTRALETAEATLKRDQVALDSVQPRLLLGWGKAVAALPDLAAFTHSLASQEAALVRIDLPLSETLSAPPIGARVAPLTMPDHLAEAQFLGPAPNADPQMQAQGFVFLMKTNPLPPGAAVTAWLEMPGGAQAGVIVPRAAVLRHEGGLFVYLQTSDDTFQRKQIEIVRSVDHGWFVKAGLQPKDKVVVVGAQQLLSEELKGHAGE
jgi:hypothetical protein